MPESVWDATEKEVESGNNSANMEIQPTTNDPEAARIGEEPARERDALFNTTTESSHDSLDRRVSSAVAVKDLENFEHFHPFGDYMPQVPSDTPTDELTETSVEDSVEFLCYSEYVPCYMCSY